MTAASSSPIVRTTGRPTDRGTRVVLGAVLATAIGLAALLAAAQAGILPKAPAYTGDPADQYRSPQIMGERAADR
jgi:hypothetical protein